MFFFAKQILETCHDQAVQSAPYLNLNLSMQDLSLTGGLQGTRKYIIQGFYGDCIPFLGKKLIFEVLRECIGIVVTYSLLTISNSSAGSDDPEETAPASWQRTSQQQK